MERGAAKRDYDGMTTNAPVVLIVEDEPLILIHSRLALEDAGYAIVAVSDGAQAMTALHERHDVRAIFTDVRLPGAIDGLALAHRVSADRPEIAILVTSGSQKVEDSDLPRSARFLAKPYTAAQVTRTLDSLTG